MEFSISKNAYDRWTLVPLTGRLGGFEVAQAEHLALNQVRFKGRTLIGRLSATWGTTVLMEELYNDTATVKGLALQGTFDSEVGEKITPDYDGYPCKAARRVIIHRNAVFVKGPVCR